MINSRQLSPPGGGIPLYKAYRYRPLQRVWFLRRFGLESGMVLRELRECLNVLIVSILNE